MVGDPWVDPGLTGHDVLRARLTAHPEYVVAGEPWIDPRVSGHLAALADDDGLVRENVRPVGLPWQEPDGGFAAVGCTDLHTAVDTEGRTHDRRSDFDSVTATGTRRKTSSNLRSGG